MATANKGTKNKKQSSTTTKKTSNTQRQKSGINYRLKHPRVLAVTPMNRGFGYAVFEGPKSLKEHGVTNLRFNRVHCSLLRMDLLLEQYQPSVVVVMEAQGSKSTIGKKILIAIASQCAAAMIPFRRISRKRIIKLFKEFGAITREDIADHLVEWLPELASVRPKRRAIWESECNRMKIFDAVSAALTFYADYEDEANSVI